MRTSAFLLLLVACKGGSSTSTSSTASGSASGSGSAVVAIDAAIAVVDAAPPIDASACKPKCLYAADHPLADAIAKYSAECNASWYDEADCEGLLYARNCIYAAYGNVFKTDAWKDRFTNEPWYKPNAKFTEKDIPAFAMANVKELKKQYEACTKPIPPVTDEDKKLAIDAFQAQDDHRNLFVNEKTKFTYEEAPKDGRRTIILDGLYWAVGGGEWKPDEGAAVTFEGDKLVEIR